MQVRVQVQYYAMLREELGKGDETLSTGAGTAEELFQEICGRHGLPWTCRGFKVSINNEFVPWQNRLNDGDEVAFIPPVAGG